MKELKELDSMSTIGRPSFRIAVLTVMIAAVSVNVQAEENTAELKQPRVPIPTVERMPALPEPYKLRDWAGVTRDYLEILFDQERRGEHLPLIEWKDPKHSVVGIPSFVGGEHNAEAINLMAALVSGSLVGIDMTRFHGHDWVAQAAQFYSPRDGVYVNRAGETAGGSFWYDTLANVLFFQLGDLYPDDPGRREQLLKIAERWLQACQALGARTDPPALPDFDHTAFRVRDMKPFDNGNRVEPEGGAAIAWMEYMAWIRSGDRRFLTTADQAIRALERRPQDRNPLYEVLLPYGVIAAARMNAEEGHKHEVAKLLNWCFEARGAPQARPWWGLISGRWGDQDVHGLVGSVRDGQGYAFAMNTFQYAGTLAPLARYDDRYAETIGKWLLHLSSAARLFYGNALDAEHQSCPDWSRTNDPQSVIAYEGLRHWKRGAVTARSDLRTVRGKVVSGDYTATHFWREAPPRLEMLEEGPEGLEHLWDFDLPDAAERRLVIAAARVSGGRAGNAFRFSYAETPEGPFTQAALISGTQRPSAVRIPDKLRGRLYLKVVSTDQTREASQGDRLEIDALSISYPSEIAPFAQGDAVVGFVSLLADSRVPVVLYRPPSAITDLSAYGSSHVGSLGGIVRASNVPGILRIDLLRTDYFHARAYPTALYYNPYPVDKTVSIPLEDQPVDLYDAVSNQFVHKGVQGVVDVTFPPSTARVLVLAPAGGKLRRDGARTLINDTVVDYGP